MKSEKKNTRREFVRNSAASLAAFTIVPWRAMQDSGPYVSGDKVFRASADSHESDSQSIQLLVRGDDMGKTYDRNLAFIKAHKEGIMTSASLMATSQFFSDAVPLCIATPTMAVGVHITIRDSTQRPVLSPKLVPSLVGPKGFFYDTPQELEKANPSAEEMEMEIRAQIAKVRSSGINVVYVDNHRGGGRDDIIFKVCKEQKLVYGRDYDGSIYGFQRASFIPEQFPNHVLPDGQRVYYGGPTQTPEEEQTAIDRLNSLTPGKWVMVMHPGLAEPNRRGATELVCSPRVKEIIKRKNIQLVSYYDFWIDEYGKPV